MRQFINNLPTEMQPCFAVWAIWPKPTTATTRSLSSVKWICSDLKSSKISPSQTYLISFHLSQVLLYRKVQSFSSTPSSSYSTVLASPNQSGETSFRRFNSEFLNRKNIENMTSLCANVSCQFSSSFLPSKHFQSYLLVFWINKKKSNNFEQTVLKSTIYLLDKYFDIMWHKSFSFKRKNWERLWK